MKVMNIENRPDPDALLAAIKKEEIRQQKGRLKIFFGMAAGVGKTYTMLQAARQALSEGADVVVGYIETHGRAETEALLQGLPIIPRRKIEYRGAIFYEMDLDAILNRKPQLVLVDELAHTNIPGSRHAKRYQDVLELLDAGINVFTTVNVQHLESRADAVQQITGLVMRETVPDSIFDRGDEIELVDITPEKLLKRLAEGKVYVPDKARLAAQKFFRRGNLTALREMSLRLTAQHVDQQLRDYMQLHKISGPWKSGERLLVAVGPSPMSAELVRSTRRVAYALQSPWIAVSVELPHRPLSPEAKRRQEKNLELARELGAEIITTTDTDLVSGIIRVARQHNVAQIMVGKTQDSPLVKLFRGDLFVSRLIKESGNIDISVIASDKIKTFEQKQLSPAFSLALRQYAYGFFIIIALAGICYSALPLIGYQAVGLILLFAIVLLALFVGRGPVIFSAAFSALIWDFFFISPPFTFHIAEPQDALMLGMYFVIASILGNLTSRIRVQQLALQHREEQAVALYTLAREVANATNINEVLVTAVKQLGRVFGAKISILLPDHVATDSLKLHSASTLVLGEKDISVATWVFNLRKPAGRFTDTLPMAEAYFVPLLTPTQVVGVIGVRTHRAEPLTIEQKALLETFASQIASAIERMLIIFASPRQQ
jgi:two-component system, OmpR family, sensor histidine kinase KdpD